MHLNELLFLLLTTTTADQIRTRRVSREAVLTALVGKLEAVVEHDAVAAVGVVSEEVASVVAGPAGVEAALASWASAVVEASTN